MLDDPKLMNDVVGEFFDRVEDGGLATLHEWISGSGAAVAESLSGVPAVSQQRFTNGLVPLAGAHSVLLLLVGVVVGAALGPRIFKGHRILSAGASRLGEPLARSG